MKASRRYHWWNTGPSQRYHNKRYFKVYRLWLPMWGKKEEECHNTSTQGTRNASNVVSAVWSSELMCDEWS